VKQRRIYRSVEIVEKILFIKSTVRLRGRRAFITECAYFPLTITLKHRRLRSALKWAGLAPNAEKCGAEAVDLQFERNVIKINETIRINLVINGKSLTEGDIDGLVNAIVAGITVRLWRFICMAGIVPISRELQWL
jgi:hypothetical protein